MTLQIDTVFGRPKVTVTEEFKEAYARWKSREITAVKAMQENEVKKTTFYKLVREYVEVLSPIYILKKLNLYMDFPTIWNPLNKQSFLICYTFK